MNPLEEAAKAILEDYTYLNPDRGSVSKTLIADLRSALFLCKPNTDMDKVKQALLDPEFLKAFADAFYNQPLPGQLVAMASDHELTNAGPRYIESLGADGT